MRKLKQELTWTIQVNGGLARHVKLGVENDVRSEIENVLRHELRMDVFSPLFAGANIRYRSFIDQQVSADLQE